MPLISELLNLPRSVNRGDFVLRLSEGITDAHAECTLRDYVVTPQLAANFKDALAFIRGALESGSSKGAYLHGSFGSGKSHFMAVLYLLLRGNPKARALPELAEVVQAQDTWAEGRKFLLVPYHMIGAHSMESAILGQYVEFVRRLHPDAGAAQKVDQSAARKVIHPRGLDCTRSEPVGPLPSPRGEGGP